ncbi:sodium/hydrogen exchanger 6-like isoform X3 [Macrosteles quadrilineatus]|uniref:sodium/hydrogen exchanger 6-like isoform X3 n=1 Tax=Macrosteles quadrilineatus TaxID=74068 RepID=UPI0023E22B2E|nr:sodium/hydrogen exchanger 6-like isoform X3 [Macrosteles quadrilineatus]XP_054265642.1 sodium/hydrogen exchanger 6-like isoform X3 [Macrosteles quadrilineatus]XP_054266528.1 sodium/hydrogen exchanger 6-like isoform X3 [Macrosteles quadrilineatus]XP_054266529.1 sodium/hydrogen exchanger 6-like isoform X3 [Macrosteles quadrilineatus]
MKLCVVNSLILSIFILICCENYVQSASTDIELDAKAQLTHRLDSLNLLVYTFLLILTVLTIWLFKHRRLRFLHETGLAVIYGLIVGALIRYVGSSTPVIHMAVVPVKADKYNESLPPDSLWLQFSNKGGSGSEVNRTYAYGFRGEVVHLETNEMDLKATFDPEIFFNIILPPIIFHAGYSLKRKYFFRNLGAILTYALVGTTISSFVVGSLMYGFLKLIPHLKDSFTFLDSLYFGALISPTDPLTILAIFNDLRVDVTLYSLVFGESVLNDAVAIVLSGAIQNYAERYQTGAGGFEIDAFFRAMRDFVGIFSVSLFIGATMGCITALMTKFTRVKDFPLLESALFFLMSYSTFLIAEASDLTGVVAVLFCGIFQAHYTYNNLSRDSRKRTKRLFELLNFLAENFIFCYIGVSMFTFPNHHFDPGFILSGFVCAALGRAANIYPLSFLINLGRKPKIEMNFQHMLFFAGLRGAMSFALAIRNTASEARQAMLTTTSIIVIATVIIQGGATMQLLTWFRIPVGVEEEVEMLPYTGPRSASYNSFGQVGQEEPGSRPGSSHDKAWLAKAWGDLDTRYMKPLLTHARPTLLETLPVCCGPVARLLTTTEQLTQDRTHRSNSDSDLCLEETEINAAGDSTVSAFPRPREPVVINPLRFYTSDGALP